MATGAAVSGACSAEGGPGGAGGSRSSARRRRRRAAAAAQVEGKARLIKRLRERVTALSNALRLCVVELGEVRACSDEPSHCFGRAIELAALDPDTKAVLRGINRSANEAKRSWGAADAADDLPSLLVRALDDEDTVEADALFFPGTAATSAVFSPGGVLAPTVGV